MTALLNQAQTDLPGVRGFAVQMPLFRVASQGSGSGIALELSGQDLREVTDVALRLMGPLMAKYGRVVPSPADFADPGEEVRVRLRPVESADVGLSQLDLDRGVQLLGDGLIIGDYLDQGDTIDLKLMVDPSIHRTMEYFGRMPLATSSGHQVTLDTVATVSRVPAPQQINRVEELPSITFEISLPPTIPLEAAKADIDAMLQQMRVSGDMPATVRHRLSGTAAKLGQVKKALLGEWTGLNSSSLYALISSRMFLALLVVFLLMAALFESWVYPLVIMFSVPLATVGGFFGLRLVHELVPEQQLDILTMLGFVILIGVVVNNAILIVHQALNLMEGRAEIDGSSEPMEAHRAIAEAVISRVRPIFMSTLTSVGGMLPLVLNPGAGSELYRGLGGVVVGGLIVSTLFTLILVPMLLSIVFDIRAKLLGRQVRGAG